ncbi:MAG: pitrilysin family protein, partial [Anaerolineae bacterium]
MVGLGLDWRLALLPSGLRLISVARPGRLTVAVRAYVRAGSRYDVERKPPDSPRLPLGLAHLTEHLLFKGTRIHDQGEICASVERLGGALDAGTTKEYATVSAVVPRQGLDVALDVVAELLIEPALREEDLWNEKLVILEEIRRARDRQGVIYDLFAETIWQEHPFRHPVHGTLEALRSLDREALLSFYQHRYVSGNMVLAVCGDVGHEEVQN